MSREIKFRAWDGEKYWYNIAPSPLPSPTLDICKKITDYDPEYYNMVDIIEGVEAIEQYTGLKDKNGKEIYEGDIVKAKIDGLWQTGAHTVSEGKATWNLEVIYNDIRYMDVFHILGSKNQPNRIYYLFDESISDVEVIGNIHENPELLEDK